MIQEIITYFILIVASGYVIYKFIVTFFIPKKGCNGCATHECGGCPLDELKKEIAQKKQ